METGKRYTIVVGIDFSDASLLALNEAVETASRLRDADVHVLAVMDDRSGDLATRSLEPFIAEKAFQARERLDEVVRARLEERFGNHSAPPFQTVIHVRIGNPADQIVRLASDIEADLVVVGTAGLRGFQRLLIGSVAERVLRLAHCPLLVVRPKRYETEEVQAPEPPCPSCVAHRRETGGAEWWCAVHSRPRDPAHAIQLSQRFHYPSPLWFGGDA